MGMGAVQVPRIYHCKCCLHVYSLGGMQVYCMSVRLFVWRLGMLESVGPCFSLSVCQ